MRAAAFRARDGARHAQRRSSTARAGWRSSPARHAAAKVQSAQALLLPTAPARRRPIATPTRCAFVRGAAARPRLPAQVNAEPTDESPSLPAHPVRRRVCALSAARRFGVALRAPRRAGADYRKLLVLVELKGGNDGLNTLVPYADPAYYALRPKIAIARDQVVQLSDRAGLHPSLAPLLPLWNEGELAVLQGVGYPEPNLSHFRSIEIWDTAIEERGVPAGRLAHARVRDRAAARVVRRRRRDRRLERARPARRRRHARDRARRHRAVPAPRAPRARRRRRAQQGARAHPQGRSATSCRRPRISARARRSRPSFRPAAFGNAIRTACQIIANPSGVAVVRVTLSGFDTHANQPATQARLLGEVGERPGGAARSALIELGRWDDTLVLTYAEFGRRPKENQNNGTDHGTANVHFALGGRVAGGFYGAPPSLDAARRRRQPGLRDRLPQRLRDGARALVGRSVAATLGGKFPTLPLLNA